MKELLMLFCITIFFFGCSKKHDRLSVDEIYISKHYISPPLKTTLRYTPPTGRHNSHVDTVISYPQQGVFISKSVYNPILIINIKNTGRVNAFIFEKRLDRKGYYSAMLPDSIINFINYSIMKMRYKGLDSAYNESLDNVLYDGPQYYLSLKKEKTLKEIIIIDPYKAPNTVIKFIDGLFDYVDKMQLTDSPHSKFRRDSLIVAKNEIFLERKSSEY